MLPWLSLFDDYDFQEMKFVTRVRIYAFRNAEEPSVPPLLISLLVMLNVIDIELKF